MTVALRLDLHVHSTYSADSSLALETIVEQLGAAGLHGFALTDHNTVAGHAQLSSLRERHPRFWLIPGIEVSTREGHVLLYGVGEAPRRDLPLPELLDWARARNGIPVLAHPFRWMNGVGRRIAEGAPVAGLEARNARTAELANARAELLAVRRHLAATGGSDAHDRRSLGRAYTEFAEEPGTLEELLEELRRSHCWVGGRSLGPAGRILLAMRCSVLRLARGFRPV
jgi:predicted metal-dependent phosphoesterase TrpH